MARLRRSWFREGFWLGLGGTVALSCAHPAPTPATPTPVASTSAARPTAPGETERAALATALRALRPGDVLDALPRPTRSEVDDVLARLGREDREGVLTPAGAAQAPLLHLAAGGGDPNALLLLASGGAAAALVEVRLTAGRSLDGLAPVITALSDAAATRWLSDVALELATPGGLTPERCADIERAAEALGRGDLRLLAARAAAAIAPSLEHDLALAFAAVRELRVDEARGALSAAERAPVPSLAVEARPSTGSTSVSTLSAAERGERFAAARQLIAAAERLARFDGSNASEVLLERGRTLLALGRARAARDLLTPHRSSAARHLGLATTVALAELGGTACPGLPTTNGHLLACAAAWRRSEVVAAVLPLLEQAWTSGAGRDRPGIEAYLGIAHVMPWLYANLAQQDRPPEVVLKESIAAVTVLEERTVVAAAAEPQLEGLALFVELLRTGLEAATTRSASGRVTVDEARRRALVRRAVQLRPAAADEALTQAAMLGVAAMFAQDTDPGPVLAALPPRIDRRYRVTRAALELWRGVAHDDPEAAERGRAGLLEVINDPAPGTDRSQLVLVIAEADAALRGGGTDYAKLYQVATQFEQPSLPRATWLRLRLDRAGALARTGRPAEAMTLLAPAAEPEIGPGTSTEIDLAAIARAYLVVLRARATTGAERAEYAKKLAGFAEEIEGQVAVGVGLWHGLWMRELAAIEAADRCRGAAWCLARVERARPAPNAEIAALVGAESARIVARGTVPLGAVTASFTYSVARGLEPRVTLDPLLLAVELPSPAAAAASKPPR
ncbi:MAG: hypothetical protein JW751_13490 [Polyangiaceae bacterium]|nr:hypothetical protein [Polyangiaceae bacterium]